MNPQQLREEAGRLAARIQQMSTELTARQQKAGTGDQAQIADFTADERAEWDRINKRYNEICGQIDVHERAEAVKKRTAQPANDPAVGRGDTGTGGAGRSDGRRERRDRPEASEEERNILFGAWARSQMGLDPTRRQERLCRRFGFNPMRRSLTVNLLPQHSFNDMQRRFTDVHPSQASRALSDFQVSSGGALIPSTLVRNLEVAMLTYGSILQACTVLETGSGERMDLPTANDTGNKGRRLGQNASVTTTGKDPTFGTVGIETYNYTSDAVLVPTTMMEDSVFDLASFLGIAQGERIGRIVNEELTTGTGNGMPAGLQEKAPQGKVAAAQAALVYDDFVKLEHAVDPAYRVGAGYMMHDNVLLALRLLKDAQNRPLWVSNIALGRPDTFNGAALTINQAMNGTIGAGKRVTLYGQLKKYLARRVRSVRFYRLEERYRTEDQDGFVAFCRFGGALLDAGGKPVQALDMAP